MTSLPLFRFVFICLGILGADSLASAAQPAAWQDSAPLERESPLFSNQEFENRGETTEVGIEEDVGHPVFLGNREVVVRGRVGDLFAAGETILIEGQVDDNAFIGGREVRLEGSIGGDLFVFGETVIIAGRLGGDLYGAFEEVRVLESGRVEGDLHVGGARVIVEGRVEGRLVGGAEEIRIDGYVGGDVLVAARSVELSGDAEIGGDLRYDTREEPDIRTGAIVHGETRRVRYSDEVEHRRTRSFDLHEELPWLGKVLSFGGFLLSLIVGALCLGLGGRTALLPSRLLSQQPAMGLGVGFLLTIFVPLAAFVLILLCITSPIGIVMLIALSVAGYLGTLITSESLGRWVLGRGGRTPNAFLCLILGLVAYYLLGYLPFLGGLLRGAWSLAGLGALFLVLRGSRPTA